jgi:hypothetical protein
MRTNEKDFCIFTAAKKSRPTHLNSQKKIDAYVYLKVSLQQISKAKNQAW